MPMHEREATQNIAMKNNKIYLQTYAAVAFRNVIMKKGTFRKDK